MDAILKQDKVIPDCFSCGTCQNICPTKSITYEKGCRMKPPAEKFKK
jgi:formate hydrogenlyase subunit 6/NADH:ubiquinone oxidoreductase subunit I